MTERDRLFLLPPAFEDPSAGPGLFHCPYCARVNGVLADAPDVRARLDIAIVPFPRPRAPVVALVGEAHQSCPVLVLGTRDGPLPPGAQVSAATGRAFIADTARIIDYLAARHGAPRPHP
jgi:hypothetical protein